MKVEEDGKKNKRRRRARGRGKAELSLLGGQARPPPLLTRGWSLGSSPCSLSPGAELGRLNLLAGGTEE